MIWWSHYKSTILQPSNLMHFPQSSSNISHSCTDFLKVQDNIRACLRSGPKVMLAVLFPVLMFPPPVLPPVRIPPRPAARPALLIPKTELPRPQTALLRSRPPADWVSCARSWISWTRSPILDSCWICGSSNGVLVSGQYVSYRSNTNLYLGLISC